jgi:hypothetical protein
MGIVTDYIVRLIERQVNEKGIVVWFDPEGTYASLAATLALPNTHVALLANSYFALRRDVDEWMNHVESDQPPRLVLYVPRVPDSTEYALEEFIAAGTVMQPGEKAQNRNTNLEVVARAALKPALGADSVETICKQVSKGQIKSLDELDRLAAQGQHDPSVLKLIFGTGQPADVALTFLTSAEHDQDLITRGAIGSLADLLNRAFDAKLADAKPEDLRARLRKHLLITEFLSSLGGVTPSSLSSVQLPSDASAVEACVQLVRTWRNRRDLQSNYVDAALRVEKEYTLGTLALDWRALRNVETFRVSDEQLRGSLGEALRIALSKEPQEVIPLRQSGFWSQVDPTVQARWALLAVAAQLLTEVERVDRALKPAHTLDAAAFIEQYTNAREPWCQLDTAHRTLERLALSIDLDPHGREAELEQLMAHVRQAYVRVIDMQARHFGQALADAHFTIGGMLYQNEVFARYVGPHVQAKMAYVLVDALRYEMARDLLTSLNPEWRVELAPAIATLPTVTSVGMAALLPGAERGVTLIDAGGGKVGLGFAGHLFKERKDRVDYIKSKLDGFYEVKLDALIGAKKSVRESIQAARFILVTSQEIDMLGETDNMPQAREVMDSALSKLARAFRLLAESGVQRIVVSADHGYLFADELDAAQLLPAPGGQTVGLHRRVWIGKGGQSNDNVLRVSADGLDLGSDLELALPYGLTGFAAGGGKAYMHGGMSLQEMIIPVLVIEPAVPAPPVTAQMEWTLTGGSPKLSTRFFSVTVTGKAVGMFEMVPPRVRIEIQSRNKSVSVPVAATYGLSEATGEIELQRKASAPSEIEANTVALMVQGDVESKLASVVLLNAETEQTLKEIKVEVAISI